MNDNQRIRRRIFSYFSVGGGLLLVYVLLRTSPWQGNTQLHTLMEVVATLLALFVGIVALVRFYTRQNNTFLFIGTGFLGTALLDGYHAIVTSSYFSHLFPSVPSHLIPWSWVASRFFLSLMLFLGWWAWHKEAELGKAKWFSNGTVQCMALVLTVASFLFFAFVPLPRAYYPEMFFGRPEEFVPGLFFLLALIGYVRKGKWKTDAFEHWLVLSLIIGLVGQVVFMSFSYTLFDGMFDMAHSLKKVSYVFVLVGLLISMYHLFRQAEESAEVIGQANEALRTENVARKQAEGELKEISDALWEQSTLMESVLNSIGEGVVVADEEGTVILTNPAAKRITGMGNTPPEEWPDKYGTFLPDTVTPASLEELPLTLAMRGKETDEMQLFLRNPSVPRGIFVSVSGRPLRDADGHIKGGVVVYHDITQRKKADDAFRKYTEELKRSNQELEQFAYIASHDLQEPLRKIQAFGDRVRSKYHDVLDERGQDYLRRMQEAAARMQALVTDLMLLSRVTSKAQPFVKVDLDQVVREVLSDLEVRLERVGGQVEVSDLPTVKADPLQMRQLLQNLISNALKFHPEDRPPVVKVYGRILAARGVKSPAYQIHVEDNGIGFDEKYLDRIFKPFQRLHGRNTFEGSGIGLAICHKIAERHGGAITATSTPGQGATFTITLNKNPGAGGTL